MIPNIVMRCDHGVGQCRNEVRRAPRIIVPSATPFEPGHRPVRMMLTLHYCEIHAGEPTLENLLTPAIKARFEDHAKRSRPIGFKCDFDRARIELVLTTTPEYRDFLAAITVRRD